MLGLRTLSALVMAPPALLAAWWGGFAFAALAAAAAAVMCWEWHRMVTKEYGLAGKIASGGSLIAALLAVVQPVTALGVVLLTAVASTALAPGRGERAHLWAGAGVLYAGLPSVALVWLRADPAFGRETLFWLLLVVWATDIAAYGSGRLLGGPLLMPRVSPKKTWAGLLGGMAAAGLVGLGTALALGLPSPVGLGLGSALLAVVAQAGDLTESWVKRRAGVKDSSNIIPGHGGVLDRVDGLLFAALAVALGTLASGVPVLVWG